MAYVLEEITSEIADQIMKDAECDPAKKRLLERRDYFCVKGKSRVINKENSSYMFYAPKPYGSQEFYDYFFFYNNKIVRVRIDLNKRDFFYFPDKDCNDLNIIKEIEDAFFIHQHLALENKKEIKITFKGDDHVK